MSILLIFCIISSSENLYIKCLYKSILSQTHNKYSKGLFFLILLNPFLGKYSLKVFPQILCVAMDNAMSLNISNCSGNQTRLLFLSCKYSSLMLSQLYIEFLIDFKILLKNNLPP